MSVVSGDLVSSLKIGKIMKCRQNEKQNYERSMNEYLVNLEGDFESKKQSHIITRFPKRIIAGFQHFFQGLEEYN